MVWVHSLSVASGASRKSLAKAFKEQGKTLKALLEGVYQGEKHLQGPAPEGALSLMSRGHRQRREHNRAKMVSFCMVSHNLLYLCRE
jgi:hypothetical protein